jgi:hypothetical protein
MLISYMDITSKDHITYENRLRYYRSPRNATKAEWTERLEFVYNSTREYVAQERIEDEAHLNWFEYRNRHLYTDDMTTSSSVRSELYEKYSIVAKKRKQLKDDVIKTFTERFNNVIKLPTYELEHYLTCCEIYAFHRVKGIMYELPFVEAPFNEKPLNELHEEEAIQQPALISEVKAPVVQQTWDDLKVNIKTRKRAFVLPTKKSHAAKKHTLSILLTQQINQNKKLEEELASLKPEVKA